MLDFFASKQIFPLFFLKQKARVIALYFFLGQKGGDVFMEIELVFG